MQRQAARMALVEQGISAVPFLGEALANPERRVRWEAAKAFVDIKEPSAAPLLVSALRDRCSDVRWLAAVALIVLGPVALDPLLKALVMYNDDYRFCQAAHHVLSGLNRMNLLDEKSLQVLRHLYKSDSYLTVPVLAHRARNALKKHE